MSQEPALKAMTRSSSEAEDLFDAARVIVAAVLPPSPFIDPGEALVRIEDLRAAYPRDYERVQAVADLMCGADIADYGARATALFAQWENDGGEPTLPAILTAAAAHFGFADDGTAMRALFVCAALAEIPNNLRYHGNDHYRKVLFHAVRLAATHNYIFAGTDQVLSKDRIVSLLAAACIHDLGHEGGDNLKGGVYTPGAMEQQAFDFSRPYLEAAGLGGEQIGEIETIVFCTDITFFAGDNSPCVRMKKIYRHFFWEDDSEDVSMMMMGKLRRYEDNPSLVRTAMILHEADVGSSAGLSYEQTIKETIRFMEERGLDTAGPSVVLSFLREQMGETMFTEAGKQLFGAAMLSVIEQAEADVEAGRMTFYD